MPGYGIAGPQEGSGLLPWAWAEERLIRSRSYWVATVWPDGRPHLMPVWGVWDRGFWFSSSARARKVRNLRANPRCVVTTEDAGNPIVLEGRARVITDTPAIAHMLRLVNQKYQTNLPLDFLEPARNATIRVVPGWAFALREADFTGSPTRSVFSRSGRGHG